MSEFGKYIVIEGHDGTGKSTQVGRVRDRLAEREIDSVEFHEPGGTAIADAIRLVIKNGDLERDETTNLLLFSACRHDIWTREALPALKMGKWVVTARNFYSTEAYQGYGEGLGLDLIRSLTRIATGDQYMNPDLAIILDLDDEEIRKQRIADRGELDNPDTFESKGADFQQAVKNAYIDIAKRYGVQLISAAQSKDAVEEQIWEIIESNLLNVSDVLENSIDDSVTTLNTAEETA
jgi:dTMP kinase